MKPPTAVVGWDDPIRHNAQVTQQLDWETELAVVNFIAWSLGHYPDAVNVAVPAGSYAKLDFALKSQTPLNANGSLRLNGRLRGQWANRNLDGWVIYVKAHLLKGEHEVRGESPGLKLGFKNSTIDKFDV